MAVSVKTPWWCSGLLGLGLILIFAGERAFAHLDAWQKGFTFAGLALVAIASLIRLVVWTKATGRQKKVEWISLLCHVGVIAALAMYYTTTTPGMEMVKMTTESAKARWGTTMTVLWLIVMVSSLIPLLMTEIVLGSNRHKQAGNEKLAEASVDVYRVKDMASSGLTIAFALALMMVTCNIAEQRNIRKDVSYFKTSSPGGATVSIVSSSKDPMTALAFFPSVDEVGDEVEGYLNELARQSGKLNVQRVDRLVDSELAKEHQISKDGTIVLIRGTKPEPTKPEDAALKETAKDAKDKAKEKPTSNYKTEKLSISSDIKVARKNDLRKFDEKIQRSLMKVIRDKRVAYLSVGHGELNESTKSDDLTNLNPLGKATLIKELLRMLNYDVKNWDGFGKPIPDDATLLMILAPRTALVAEDLRSIDEYLAKGGRLLFALDPDGEATLGDLEGRLGVSFDKTSLADDKAHFVRYRSSADYKYIMTNQFSSHSSVTTISRAGANAGILMVNAGSFKEGKFTKKAGKEDPKRTFVIRSMVSSYQDKNSNNTYDKGDESRARHNLAAAIEDPAAQPANLKEGETHDGMRAFVISDGEIFSDGLLSQFQPLAYFIADIVKWLGGEEEFIGDTKNEEDVRIEHTKSEDATWYYLTLVGAPLLVLLLGLGFVGLRRRRIARRVKR